MNKEPVLTASAVTAFVLAVFGLLNITISQADASSISAILALVVPLAVPMVSGWLARRRVTPVPPELRGSTRRPTPPSDPNDRG